MNPVVIGSATLWQGDALAVMAGLPPASVDLVFGSPPYEDARTYDMNFSLAGEDWVAWMVQVVRASLRVSRGLVAFVVEGRTRDFSWSATPVMLMADLRRAGISLRKPPAFQRVGIPGSGGPDWLRNDYEFIVCATNGGKLPWSENTAMGHPPKWGPGGEMSHRVSNGTRVNQRGHPSDSGATTVRGDGTVRSHGKRPSHRIMRVKKDRGHGYRLDGKLEEQGYDAPAVANPGNVIKVNVGGGVMGSALAHENEAPFPEALAEFFVRSFCPPGGTVLDPFSGSGTTAAVALQWGRKAIGIDIRESQIDLARRRIADAMPLFTQEAK